MSVAPQLAVGVCSQPEDDTWFSVFQSVLNPFSTTLLAGNFFLGLQAYTAIRVPMGELLGLARGGTLETVLLAANVTFTAAGTWTAGGTIVCNVMVDDSSRGASEDGLGDGGALDPRLSWKSPNGFGPSWRPDGWGVFDIRVEDTGGTAFLDQGLGTTQSFGIRSVPGHREQMAARFVVPVGPSWSIARVLCELRRFGNPTGSMEIAIQASQSNGFGDVEPDGVDLGVSAAVLNAIVPPAPASAALPFAFTPDVVLPAGEYWIVMRPNGVPYAGFPDYIVWMQRRVFFGVGGSHRTAVNGGNRFDIGNFPGHVDLHRATLAKQVGTDIVWNPVARVSGQTIATPDLSPLVQEVILTSGHETASALCFTFRTVGETRTYRFASVDHPTLAAPGFACQYRRRDVRGEVL